MTRLATTRLAAALLLALSGVALAQQKRDKGPVRWEPVGLSGGGAMFAPAISPVDPKLILLNCDMSAAYVSQDGGASWRMIHHSELRSSTRCRPAFHPVDSKVVVAASGDSGLRVSRDKGEHWSPLGKLPAAPRGEVAIDPGRPDLLLVGTDDGICRSLDGGATWARCEGPRGEALSFHFDQTTPAARRTLFAATKKGVWRSDDAGDTWVSKASGLPLGAALRSFAGGSNAKAKVVLLYAAVPCEVRDGALAGGLYRSSNRGDSWESAMGEGLNKETKAFDRWAHSPVVQYHHVLTSNARPRTAYAFNAGTGVPPPHHATVYRTDDAGQTWQATFQADPRYPGPNVERDYTVVNVRQFYQAVPNAVAGVANDADHLLFLDDGRCYQTLDGGKSWRPSHTRPATPGPPDKDTRWLCNGLVVTTTWNFYVDPFDAARQFICYTDIGFARSPDHGKTWQWWALEGRAPWVNTCYELAFDPQVPGKVWGAFSNVHDIPNANVISGRHKGEGPGGVCVSTDGTLTWGKSNAGLPEVPVTSVALDPRSKAGARVLYAGTFGSGVYRSTDDGATWVARNEGLGTAENRRVARVQVHADGTVFALVTALRKDERFVPAGPGLYRSKDGGGTWELANASSPLLWPKDFTLDPKDSRVVYLGAADARPRQEGGLYRTTDGGATWARILRQGPEHFGAYLHPKKRGWIYATLTEGAPGAGLWLSKDDGATWSAMNGLPFSNVQRVVVDPANENAIWATTFGGSVWRGPASE